MISQKNNFIFIVSLFVFVSTKGFSSSFNHLKYTSNKKAILTEYNEIFKSFSKKMCPAGTEEKFWELTKEYRGDGYYIPVNTDNTLDILSIKKNLNYLKQKVKNITYKKSLLKKLNKAEIVKRKKRVENKLDKILTINKDIFYAKSTTDKNKFKSQAQSELKELNKQFMALIEEVEFLTSYQYPVDHLANREKYDQFKAGTSYIQKLRANETYFYRKIVEDGAQNPNHSRTDKYLRALIDQVTLTLNRLSSQNLTLTEDLRYDLEDLFEGIDKQMRYKNKELLARMSEWEDRSRRALAFYQSLVKNKINVNGKETSGRELISKKNKARYILKDWVLNKHQEVYQFWAKQKEIHRALYAMETILTNEVGTFDSREGIERADVAQVVHNRSKLKEYNFILPKDSFYPYLKKINKHENKNKWLNLLFKEGEFSFSYYFISGNVRIYCPEMTRNGKRLRQNNLRISYQNLLNPRSYFPGVRYFSRASMLGRIDMAKLWTKFTPLQERPGKRIPLERNLKSLFKKKRYKLLYEFKDPKGTDYLVVIIDKKTYVVSKKYQHFYEYRNPHYFRYFQPVI